ncbi:hypothetical protein [uncultured Roseibium sp.]|uniref:hypothetical protein n=1 Tax=uncultured Roseibium sp. TaxID=1936171 RepID=UPI0032179D04
MREDLEKYLPTLEGLDLTEEEKFKVLEETWAVTEALVDLVMQIPDNPEAQKHHEEIVPEGWDDLINRLMERKPLTDENLHTLSTYIETLRNGTDSQT